MARPKKLAEVAHNNPGTKRIYAFSTLACDQRYIHWGTQSNDIPTEIHSTYIKGGAGIANDRFITPLGVMTEITDYDLELLEQNPVFKMHRDNGYIVIQESSADPDKVSADMSQDDPSRPLTDADYKDDETPVINGNA